MVTMPLPVKMLKLFIDKITDQIGYKTTESIKQLIFPEQWKTN